MDRQKCERLFKEHYRGMYRYAYIMLYDADDARDVVSEVWTTILQKEMEVEEATAGTYLKRLVHNRCINVIEHKRIINDHQPSLDYNERARLITDDEDIIRREERWKKVETFIENELTPRTQEILKMRYLQNLSYKDIAQRLEVSTAAINKHLTQALRRLREVFNNSSF